MKLLTFKNALAAAALLLGLAPAQAFAIDPGLKINSIEGSGTLKDNLDDRLKDDFQVNYQDCLLYLGYIPKGIQPCSQDVPCSDVKLQIWGFLTIPLMSLVAFLAIVVVLFLLNRRSHEEK